MSTYNFERDFFNYLNNVKNYLSSRPFVLGGVSGGDGGSGGPPGGFIGYLPQGRVAYDTTEAATFSGTTNLVDNLNHIRARIDNITISGGGGHVIENNGTPETNRAKLNFIGATITDNSSNNSTDVTFSGISVIKNTQSNIEAISSPSEPSFGYATDNHLLGYYNGTIWIWLSGGSSSSLPVYGNLSSGGASPSNTYTFSHTVAMTTNRLLLVTVGMRSYSTGVSVTYNGIDLFYAGGYGGSGNDPRSEIWYLVAPDTGTHNVVVTVTQSNEQSEAIATSWSNVNQSTPLDTTNGTHGTGTAISSLVAGSSGNISISAVCTEAYSSLSVTPGTGQASLGSSSCDGNWTIFMSSVNYANPTTMSWTLGSSRNWALGCISIKGA